MDDSINIPKAHRLEQEIRRELAAGERLIWHGVPDPLRVKRPFLMWLFAIPWTAFAIGWTALALMPALTDTWDDGGHWWEWVFPLWGLPFIAVGLYMLYLPFKARLDAQNCVYALTDKRLMSLVIRRTRKLHSVSLDTMGPVNRSEDPDGWGGISIQTGSHIDSDGDRVIDRFEMVGIADVARVERLLQEARAGVKASS